MMLNHRQFRVAIMSAILILLGAWSREKHTRTSVLPRLLQQYQLQRYKHTLHPSGS
jgi:hypothetical protein